MIHPALSRKDDEERVVLRAGLDENLAPLHRSALSKRLHARELRGQNRKYLLFPRRECDRNRGGHAATLIRFEQRHIDEMLRKEPHLLLVSADDVRDQQVVRAVVARFRSQPRHRSRFLEHDFVRVQEA